MTMQDFATVEDFQEVKVGVGNILADHTERLNRIEEKLADHTKRLDGIDAKLDALAAQVVEILRRLPG